MSLLIVPLLYPDLAGLLNFSYPFLNNFRIATIRPELVFRSARLRSHQSEEALITSRLTDAEKTESNSA